MTAEGLIKEADYGHVARAILGAANSSKARLLVLGSSTRKDLPWVPFGSVANRLLHMASLSVLIVPMHRPEAVNSTTQPAEAADAAAD